MKTAIATLADLGLTILQAKVYIALAKLDVSTISEISEVSNVHRTDLYEILKDLEEKGLAEREIDNPIRYRATPMSEGLDLLLKKKNEGFAELQINVVKLKGTFRKLHKVKTKTENASRFIIISEKRIIDSVSKSLDRAQRSVDLVLSRPRFSRGLVLFSDKIDESCTRGVKWRFITERPHEEELFLNQIKKLKGKPNCQLRFLTSVPSTILGIYDQKEVFVFKYPTASINKSPALWSDNKSLISITSDYFNMLWLTALEDEFQETED